MSQISVLFAFGLQFAMLYFVVGTLILLFKDWAELLKVLTFGQFVGLVAVHILGALLSGYLLIRFF